MTKERIIEIFYNNLKEYEGGITNLKYKLGWMYDDLINDTLIYLFQYNEKYGITEDDAKGLFFITLKTRALSKIQYEARRNYTSFEDLTTEFKGDDINDTELDEEDTLNLSKLKKVLTQEEYEIILKYYDCIYEDSYDKALTAKVARIKQKLGFKIYYKLITPEREELMFKTKNDIAKHIGIHNTNLSEKPLNIFNFKGKVYRIKKITELTKLDKLDKLINKNK